MIRPGWRRIALVTVALGAAIAPGPGFAQFGGIGGGGFPPGRGFGAGPAASGWTVEVESTGGARVTGPIHLNAVTIDGDFGRYEIRPEKIRMIRFDAAGLNPPTSLTVGGVPGVPVAGTVVAASGEEIVGTLFIPSDWTMTTDLGTLTLHPNKLRSITFIPPPEPEADVMEPGPPPGRAGRGPIGRSNAPLPLQLGPFFWAISPSGDRVVVKHTESGAVETLRLPASDDAPLRVTPIATANLAALHLEGPEIARVAVFNARDRAWHPLDLREPVAGRATPVVSAGAVAYALGRYVYAFGAEANRWATLELPEGAQAVPVVNIDSVTVNDDGRIHTFRAGTGEWTTVDVRDLLSEGEEAAEEGADPGESP